MNSAVNKPIIENIRLYFDTFKYISSFELNGVQSMQFVLNSVAVSTNVVMLTIDTTNAPIDMKAIMFEKNFDGFMLFCLVIIKKRKTVKR